MNMVDIAPDFSGSIMGVTNGISAISGFVIPFFTTAVVSGDRSDPTLWRYVFFSGTAFYLVAIVVFYVFGSAKRQPFNNLQAQASQEEELSPLANSV